MFLETSLRVGGTETVLTRLIERFDRERIKPSLCCVYDLGALGEKLVESGMKVHTGLAKNRWDLGFPLRLFKLLKQEKVDALFIVNQPILQFWGVWCAIFARVPVRVTAIRSTGKINRIYRRLLINFLTFPWITRVTALSQMHKDYLVEKEKIDKKKIEIITNGVDLAKFEALEVDFELKMSLGIPRDACVVGIVAMLRPEKGHDVFIRAADQVIKKHIHVHFLIVGDGPERPRLEGLVRELGVEKKIHFLGVRNDVSKLLNLFDVAVLSSQPVVETVSNSVLEYMAMRKPVISTKVGSLPEMIEDGKTGYLVEPGDWKEMAAKMALLLQDRDLAVRMGEAGRERVEKIYSIGEMIHNWEALFVKLTSPSGGCACGV